MKNTIMCITSLPPPRYELRLHFTNGIVRQLRQFLLYLAIDLQPDICMTQNQQQQRKSVTVSGQLNQSRGNEGGNRVITTTDVAAANSFTSCAEQNSTLRYVFNSHLSPGKQPIRTLYDASTLYLFTRKNIKNTLQL